MKKILERPTLEVKCKYKIYGASNFTLLIHSINIKIIILV